MANISKRKYLSIAVNKDKFIDGILKDIGKYECNCWYNPIECTPLVQNEESQESNGI